MGNCLPKFRKKSRVDPAPAEDIHEVLSRSTKFQGPNQNNPTDMVKALRDGETNAENAAHQEDGAKEAASVASNNAMAFKIEFDDSQDTPEMPKRLTERLHAEKEPRNEIEYTCEEEALMAEILGENILQEVQEKVIQEDIKSATPVTLKRKIETEQAEADRGKAAERRRENIEQ